MELRGVPLASVTRTQPDRAEERQRGAQSVSRLESTKSAFENEIFQVTASVKDCQYVNGLVIDAIKKTIR